MKKPFKEFKKEKQEEFNKKFKELLNESLPSNIDGVVIVDVKNLIGEIITQTHDYES